MGQGMRVVHLEGRVHDEEVAARPQHLAHAEVDLAASPEPAIGQAEWAVGRTLGRPLAAREALRKGDLKARHWFAAGETVTVVAQGQGFAVTAEGQALGPGLEGQLARIRTESGRIGNLNPASQLKKKA